MYTLGNNSYGIEVGFRTFGKQDRGISPKGANDQSAFITALALLGNPQSFRCFEIYYAQEIIFSQNVIFTLTGASYQKVLLNGQALTHATVYEAKKGDVLTLNQRAKGFRTYLTASNVNLQRVGKKRKPYHFYFTQDHPYIRVTQGPEFDYLTEDFFQYAYKISSHSDMSGLRLEKKLRAKKFDIITAAVTDGTIQLTKDGPIVLMRHRQTTGGYPRVFNVIEADMDRLAQYPHGSFVRFELIPMEKSIEYFRDYEKVLRSIKEDLR